MSTLNTSCIILPLGGARIKGFFVCFYYTVIPRFWLTMLCVVVSAEVHLVEEECGYLD